MQPAVAQSRRPLPHVGYFDAPAALDAPLGFSAGRAAVQLPVITLAFCSMDGLKSMKVSLTQSRMCDWFPLSAVHSTYCPSLFVLPSAPHMLLQLLVAFGGVSVVACHAASRRPGVMLPAGQRPESCRPCSDSVHGCRAPPAAGG